MARAALVTKKFEGELNTLRGAATRDLATVGKVASGTGHDLTALYNAAVLAKRGVADLGDKAATAAVKVDAVGDEASEAGRDMLTLAMRITAAQAALHALSVEFAGNGDASLTPKIRQARRELAELQRVAKTLTPAAGTVARGTLSGLGDMGASLRGAMIPLLVGSAVAASPGIALAVGAAVAGGVGIGGIIGGIALAAKDARVKDAWSGLGRDVLADLQADAQRTFVAPLLKSADDFRDAWADALGPSVGRAFETLAGTMGPLSRGSAEAARELGPALEALARGGDAVLTQLGESLPGLITSVRHFGESLDAAGPGLAAFTDDLLDLTGAALEVAGPLTEISSILYQQSTLSSLGNLGEIRDFYMDLLGQGPGVVGILADVNREVGDMSPNMQALSDAWNAQADAANTAYRSMTKLNEAYDEAHDRQRNLTDAEIDFEEALDDLTQSFEDNGTSLSRNTEKGRDNARAVLNGIDKARAMRAATLEQTGSLSEANRVYDAAIKKLEGVASKAGITASRLRAMAGDYRVNVSVRTYYTTVGAPPSGISTIGNVSGRTASAFAAGTPSAPPGLAWVGERGPELVAFRGGERVMSNPQSMSVARGFAGGTGGWGGPMQLTVNLTVDGSGQVTRRALISDAKGRGVGEATIRMAYP